MSNSWLVLVWRLPTGLSTQRVSLWRSLRNLGAVGLTPGAAILPFKDELLEQLDWLAQGIEEHSGDAWVLPVGSLSEAEEKQIRNQMRADRAEEYGLLAHQAGAWLRQSQQKRRLAGLSIGEAREREVGAMKRRFAKVRQRDYFNAPGRREAALLIDRCLALSARAARKGATVRATEQGGEGRALRHARASSR
jgi:ChrB-like protein